MVSIGEKIEEKKTTQSPIYKWALKIDQPFYVLLGVKKEAPASMVQRSFEKIVKDLHLNTIQKTYKDTQEQEIARKLFDAISTAVATLTNPELKVEYLEKLKNREKINIKENPRVEAEALIQKASTFLARNNFDRAIELSKEAIEKQPKESSYLVYQAEAIMKKSAFNKEEYSSNIKDLLSSALKLNNTDYNAYFVLGRYHKLVDDLEKARDCFAKASELNPKFDRALTELRLINRRLEDGHKTQESKQLFGGLFQKK